MVGKGAKPSYFVTWEMDSDVQASVSGEGVWGDDRASDVQAFSQDKCTRYAEINITLEDEEASSFLIFLSSSSLVPCLHIEARLYRRCISISE
jgi:hypothetical protein